MTFGALKTEVFRKLEESSSAPVFWTEADVEASLNEGLMEISDATEWRERHITVDLLSQRPYYDLRTLVTDTVLSVGPAFNTQTNRWLMPSRVVDVDRRDRRWERVIGAPERLIIRGLWWLGYWPRTNGDTGTMKQYFTALPEQLAADDDVPGFPETLHYGLVEYALSDLWAQDGETRKALAAWQAYLGYEASLQALVDGRVGVPRLHGFH